MPPPPLCPSLCPSPTGDSAISFLRSYFLNFSFILLIDSSGSGEMLHGFARLDGFFLNVKEGVDEMIKLLANEPSVGLFFVEQHAQTSMPYLLGLKNKVGEKVHEVTLHTEDIEDSICSVRSMTEYGIPIVEEMIRDLNKSLLIMSGSQPKRSYCSYRPVRSPSWVVQISTRDSFSCSIGSDHQHGGSSHSNLLAALNSAKQKAAGLRWSQPVATAKCPKSDGLSSTTSLPVEAAEGDELTSSDLMDAQVDDKTVTVAASLCGHDMTSRLRSI